MEATVGGEPRRSGENGHHGPVILFDASELRMPTPRKLHTALAELEGWQVAVSPTVAAELGRLFGLDAFRPREVPSHDQVDSRCL